MKQKHSNNSFRQISQLEPFLKSIRRVVPVDNGYKQLVVVEERSYVTDSGLIGKLKPVLLWYKDIDKFSITTFRNVLKKAFEIHKHRYSDELADSFLLLSSYFQNDSDTILILEEFFLTIQTVSLFQYYLLSGQIDPDFKGFQFGEFTFGRLDEKKFAYRCRKATSDYFERYHNRFDNRISIERRIQNVTIIAWQSLTSKYKVAESFSEALLIYFEKLSELMFQDFWIDFTEQQSLQISLGIPYINAEKFMRQFNAEKISIYSKISAFDKLVGYVVPTLTGSFSVSVPYLLDDEIRTINSNLQAKYGFVEFTVSEIHKTIQSFTRFNAKAYIHFDEGRINEAFLHFVIALDLLFGDKGESTQTVSKRAAVLTHRTFDITFEEQKKAIQKIYDVRSKYVHNGDDVDISLLKSLMGICRVILEVLFDLQSQKGIDKLDAFMKWIKKLDYVITSYDADVSISQEELTKLGIYKRELPLIEDI